MPDPSQSTKSRKQQPFDTGNSAPNPHDSDIDEHKRLTWGRLRPISSEYSDDEDISSTTVPRANNTRSLVSPISNNHEIGYRDSSVSEIESIHFSRQVEDRKGSEAITWPHHSPSIKKQEPVVKQTQGTQNLWNIAEMYRNAKGIYKVGPKGEGQKLWTSYQKAREVKRDLTEIREITPWKQIPQIVKETRRQSTEDEDVKAIYKAGPKGEGQKLWSSYKKARGVREDFAELEDIAPLKLSSLLAQETRRQSTEIEDARAIYKAEPKGEGQKLWSIYKRARGVHRDLTDTKEVTPMKSSRLPAQGTRGQFANIKGLTPTEPVPKRTPEPRRPSAGLTASPPSRATSVQIASSVRRDATEQPKLRSQDVRKDSEATRASRELPFGIHPEIQRFIDTAKPLPPVPRLQPAPKLRPQIESKALPPLLHLQERTKPRSKPHVDASSSRPVRAPHHTRNAANKFTAPPWWGLAGSEMIPDLQTPNPTYTKAKPAKSSSTKPLISRPQPISAMSHTANVPAEMGGVGGPTPLRPLPNTMSERQKGKQKGQPSSKGLVFPKKWYDNLPTLATAHKERQDSDASFQCAGIDGPSQYPPREGPNRFVHAPSDDAANMPSPLFSRSSGAKTGGFEGRDTKFYQPYVEVLEEYNEGGMT
ncbi:hypothetical protein CC86DRAFT_377359 [Ophiobolus disseminans]|uniref:Uncharacterized protein n=1 Tax=Ophiobolus disseminans TaxID=1469910 RepID=A0A6A7AFV1_9PLEO|nr:hypothetical protein CC86DRAFT_377359 [Ophiobolus disseminans]